MNKAYFTVPIVIILVIAIILINFPNQILKIEKEDEMPKNYPYIDEDGGFNVQITTGERPNNEPHIAINPKNPLNIVAASNDYNTPYVESPIDFPYPIPSIVGGDAWAGYYTSFDGGKTWTEKLIPGYPADTTLEGRISPLRLRMFQGAGDPVLDVDADGNFYLAGIAFRRTMGLLVGDSGIWVAKSTDGGETFPSTNIRIVSQGYDLAPGFFHDKEWLCVDRNNGNVYVVWAVFNGLVTSEILFSKSTDGGNTWSFPTVVSNLIGGETSVQGSQIDVDSNGTIHISWIDFGSNTLRYVYSTDEGESFSEAVSIADVKPIPSQLPNGIYRTPTLPAMDIDHGENSSYKDTIYISWNDYRDGNADILMVYSRNGGKNWSEPIKVNDDDTENDQFFPAISISPNGYINMIFYDRRDDENNTLLNIYYAQSINGGENFTNMLATDISFDGSNSAGKSGAGFIGDYIGIATSETRAVGVWCDTRDGTSEKPNTNIYTVRVVFEKE